ncbi:MAG: sulfatase-like hydrolase/transferase [Planctomycetota bacterium]
MNRRKFLKTVGLGAAALAIHGCNGIKSAVEKEKPLNFVFILIDDMGWTDLGCYGSGFYDTPNIDTLASEGMRFTDAYAACPVCSPTRASILSGKYPARLGLTQWIGADGRPTQYIRQLPLEEVTIAEAFKQAGYATGFIGKWHLGGEDYHPEKQGFDINIGGYYKGAPPSYFAPYRIPTMKEGPKGEYLTDRHTNDALEFIKKNKDKPFLLYLSHYAVHTPRQAKKELIAKYKAKAKKLPKDKRRYLDIGDKVVTLLTQDNPEYAGMVESVDQGVGKIMSKLKKLGIDKDTVVIFMSDNGGQSTLTNYRQASTSNEPLRAGKGWLYEGGIREPMIIKWPGVTRPGSTCSVPVTSTDFYPTMLEMANLPLKPEQHADGASLTGLLKGAKSLDREAIFWHYPHYHGSGSRPGGAIRAGDYKLIEFYEDNRVELYNLREDISEQNELSTKKPEKTAELSKKLHEWQKKVNAKMPKRKALEEARKRFEKDFLKIR